MIRRQLFNAFGAPYKLQSHVTIAEPYTMAAKCPRSKIRSLVKKRISKTNMRAKKTDIIIWLNYMLFIQRLAKRAEEEARANSSKTINDVHVQTAVKDVLRSCKG